MLSDFSPSGVEHGWATPARQVLPTMLSDFSPSGVEHVTLNRVAVRSAKMLSDFSPSGVEHRTNEGMPTPYYEMLSDFSPSGVEHIAGLASAKLAFECFQISRLRALSTRPLTPVSGSVTDAFRFLAFGR